MNADAAFKASAQLAEGSQSGMRAFDNPAVAPESVIAIDAFANDMVIDAPSS
jgi:hypothetical protein